MPLDAPVTTAICPAKSNMVDSHPVPICVACTTAKFQRELPTTTREGRFDCRSRAKGLRSQLELEDVVFRNDLPQSLPASPRRAEKSPDTARIHYAPHRRTSHDADCQVLA